MAHDLPQYRENGDDGSGGWLYAGVSPDTHKPLFIAPADDGLANWSQAMDYAQSENVRLPSRNELKMLFNARAAIGGFAPGPHWSSSEKDFRSAYTQDFDNGAVSVTDKSAVRAQIRFVSDF